MANIKSQIKRIGTNLKAAERNKAVRSEVKTAIRASREATASGDKAAAAAALAVAADAVAAELSWPSLPQASCHDTPQ